MKYHVKKPVQDLTSTEVGNLNRNQIKEAAGTAICSTGVAGFCITAFETAASAVGIYFADPNATTNIKMYGAGAAVSVAAAIAGHKWARSAREQAQEILRAGWKYAKTCYEDASYLSRHASWGIPFAGAVFAVALKKPEIWGAATLAWTFAQAGIIRHGNQEMRESGNKLHAKFEINPPGGNNPWLKGQGFLFLGEPRSVADMHLQGGDPQSEPVISGARPDPAPNV